MVFVSVVGDFYSSVLPLFYEFRERITTHIIIHDDYKNDIVSAKKIINGTLSFIKKNNLPIKSFVIKMDEDSFEAANKVNKLVSNHVDDYEQLYINITDGLANVGILLSHAFREKGAKILTYDRYDNEYNLLTKNSLQTHKIKTSMSIKDHLLLKNVEILSTQDIEFAQKHEKGLNLFFEKYESDRLLYKKDKENDPSLLNKPTGFLYEYYIYNLVKELDFDDILLGVKVKDNRLDDIYLENEYDILIMKDNHLHMIECKYLKVLDTTALLYKLDSVRETLDEDANIMIVSDFDSYNETANKPNIDITQTFKRALAKKIYMRGSPTKSIEIFMRDVNRAFLLETNNIEALCAKRKSFASVKERERQDMKKTIISFLKQILHTDVDFFDAKELNRLLQFEKNKQLSQLTRDAMKDSKLQEFIRLIIKMLLSKKEYISINDIYKFYEEHLKNYKL